MLKSSLLTFIPKCWLLAANELLSIIINLSCKKLRLPHPHHKNILHNNGFRVVAEEEFVIDETLKHYTGTKHCGV